MNMNMNILTQLRDLDDLLVEYTKPPTTSVLRNKLALAIAHAQTYSEVIARQEVSLAWQAETIERLTKEIQKPVIGARDSDPGKGIKVCYR